MFFFSSFLYIFFFSQHSKVVLGIPPTVNTNGICGDEYSQLILSWLEANPSAKKSKRSARSANDDNNKNNQVVFTFINDGTTAQLDNIEVAIYLDKYNFPNASGRYFSDDYLINHTNK